MTDKERINLLWSKLNSFGMFCSKALGGDDKWHLHTCDAGWISGGNLPVPVREPCEEDCTEIAAILDKCEETANSSQ